MTGTPLAPAFTPFRSGGEVHALIGEWTGKGFKLLSTAPQGAVSRPLQSIYTKSSHAGSVWDDARETMWTFGAETHEVDMDNAVYGWRASDGRFVKHYDGDPASGYRMDAAGVLWSSASKDRPWAMHTYRRMRMVPGTDEFEVMYDPREHAYMSPHVYENPAMTLSDSVPVIWYYNVLTGKWRHQTIGDSAKMVGGIYYAQPIGFESGYGWFGGNGSTFTKLSPNGTYSTVSVFGKANNQIHSYMFSHNRIAYRVGGNSSATLYSKHPLDNIGQSVRFQRAEYSALANYSTANMASAMMPDGKIVIFPTIGTEMHPMILDPIANTVVPTGHVLTGMEKPGLYELAAEWSKAHQAVILLTRRFNDSRVYGYRP